MSDRPQEGGAQGGQGPLFQRMDEQERVYAPEEVPGAVRPEADDNDLTSPVIPPAPTTAISTPELTMAAPASIAEAKENAEAEREQRGE